MALTLRLTADDEKALERIKASTGSSTASATIKHMIQHWGGITQDRQYYMKTSSERAQALRQLQKSIQNKLLADQVLADLAEDDSVF